MQAQCEMEGNRIVIRWSSRNRRAWGEAKDAVKAAGARFRPSDRSWTAPLDLEMCRRLRDIFGPDLAIGPDLWAWAAAQRRKESNLTALTDISKIDLLEVVDLPRVRTVAPTMWEAMQNRPYQPVAAKYMAEAVRCLNGDQPGIGKTIETLAALVEAQVTGPVLILAPKTSCMVVWEKEIPKWLAQDINYSITQTAGLSPKKREEAWAEYSDCLTHVDPPDTIHFLIANAEQAGIRKFTECPAGICDGDEDWCPELDRHVNKSEKRRPFLHSIEWSAIVADETHKWLINTRGKKASQVGYGFTRLKVKENGPMYALSGTPLKGKKWNIFGTLNWLWPKQYTSKWKWIGQYFEVIDEEKDIGRRGTITTKVITGQWKSMHDKEAFYRSLGMVMIRRTKDELRKVNPDWMPPEKRYHDIWVDMEGSQKTHYKAMEKSAAVTIGGERLTATGILAELTRLKQFANMDGRIERGQFIPSMPSSKLAWLLQFLEERGIEQGGDLSEDVRKVVVASQFTQCINAWAAELRARDINVEVLTGEVKDTKREAMVERFQNDDSLRVLFINTTAGGVSITLDAADDIVIMDETWVPDEQEQVEDRVHRASNVEHQVDVWYVRTKGTVEEGIADTNRTKAESNHVVLDAPRGLRFAEERFGVKVKGNRKASK